ncbi:MAG: fldA [Herbinix sp.]|jgi:cinnamoyl-CoA:phenyllactate CoA-transferase|nr:fldA [Herbinix sp.]
MSVKFLEGVKIVELATFIAAPAATRLLADWGAEVIKIEAAGGDPVRYVGPDKKMPLDQNESLAYDYENANKKGIVLNLKSENGMKAFHKLLDECDMFVTNLRTQALEKLGIDYETLSKKKPELVFGQILGYGRKGPLKDKPGYDFTAFAARGGWTGTLYEKGTSPVNCVPGMGDHQCGIYLASGLLAAYINAQRTGKGDKVTVSLYHAAVYGLATMIHSAQYGNHYPISREDMLNPLQTTYITKDEVWIQLAIPEYNKYFAKIFATIGMPELASNEKYDSLAHVAKNPQEVNRLITAAIKEKTLEDWTKIFEEVDLCFEVCQSWEQVIEDPQAWESDVFAKLDYPSGPKAMTRTPVMFDMAGLPDYEKGPQLGEDTEEVLLAAGFTSEEIKTMKENGDIK